VVEGQRLMQASSDIFLGWATVDGIDGRERDFYVRQLRDWKGSVEPSEMVEEGLKAYGELCSWTLARAHARTGDRIAIASYLGEGNEFDHAIAEFGERYADLAESDYAALVRRSNETTWTP
jgi:predicted alpha/beta hydrolase